MANKSNPQFVEVLWNTTANREATTNDCIKYAMVQMVSAETEEELLHWFNALNDAKQKNQIEIDNATEKELKKIPTYYYPKMVARVDTELGNIRFRKGKKPIAKVIFD